LSLAVAAYQLAAGDKNWPPTKVDVDGRKCEVFRHGPQAAWGYKTYQNDSFVVVHPKAPRTNAPLYVVLHSAGHDVWSAVKCTAQFGNHDIYRAPDDFYALYLDCRANKGDWWWGGRNPKSRESDAAKGGGALSPAERRVIGTVAWVIDTYGIDPNRVYLSGNSMGGSGTLGIGLRHGDLFAAIKANVPAGIEHVWDRMHLAAATLTAENKIPEPPVVIDYSGVNDHWSIRHEAFAKAMNDRKYPFYFYWGPFGHANNDQKMMKVNDLIHSFDWLAIRKNAAYAVFTNASCNDALPTFGNRDSKALGQVNAFFRWTAIADSAAKFEMSLHLISPKELTTRFTIPTEATADVSIRRLQEFVISPGDTLNWRFAPVSGTVTADASGLLTIPALTITATPETLTIWR